MSTTPRRHERAPAEAVADIRKAIEQIQARIDPTKPEHLVDDEWNQLAVQRALENISEASRHIPEELKARHPHIPWRQVADFGNVGRHGYFAVQPDRLLKVIRDDLPSLSSAIEAISAELDRRAQGGT